MVTLYNVISADGYIARENGDEDFIPDELWSDFIELCKKFDVLVMGRKTYDAIQEYPKELIDELDNLKIERIVVTRDQAFIPKLGYIVKSSPKEVVASGAKILLSSGPTLNAAFLKEGLIDQIIFYTLPDRIGKGIKVFDGEPNLSPVSVEDKKNGRKWCVYRLEAHES
jgi:dihydrofolate reductase